MACWRVDPCISLDAADSRNLQRIFAGRQDAAVARFGALRQFDFDHFDRRQAGDFGKALRVEFSSWRAAAEVGGTDLPDKIAAVLQMMFADAAFAGIMRETAAPGAAIQGPDGVGAERAEAQRGNIEQTGAIRLLAGAAADRDAQIVGHIGRIPTRQRMGDPFVADPVDIEFGAVGHGIHFAFGALINHGAKYAVDRNAVGIRFDEILLHQRPEAFHQLAGSTDERVIAQQGMPVLQYVIHNQGKNRDLQRKAPQ